MFDRLVIICCFNLSVVTFHHIAISLYLFEKCMFRPIIILFTNRKQSMSNFSGRKDIFSSHLLQSMIVFFWNRLVFYFTSRRLNKFSWGYLVQNIQHVPNTAEDQNWFLSHYFCLKLLLLYSL